MPTKFPVERREALIDPGRRRVLDPARIISLIPIKRDHVVVDVGCGNGFFTFPMADYLTHGKVYAVDMQNEMLQDVRNRVAAEGVKNVEAVLSEELVVPLQKGSADGIFSAFMFHETLEPSAFLRLMRGLLKPGGWLAILEWYKRETDSGPPLADRIEEQVCLKLLREAGFRLSAHPYLSDEHYMFVMENPAT